MTPSVLIKMRNGNQFLKMAFPRMQQCKHSLYLTGRLKRQSHLFQIYFLMPSNATGPSRFNLIAHLMHLSASALCRCNGIYQVIARYYKKGMSIYLSMLPVYRISMLYIWFPLEVLTAGSTHTNSASVGPSWMRAAAAVWPWLTILCQADASDTRPWVSKGLNKCSPFRMWHRECRRWWSTAIQITGILLL